MIYSHQKIQKTEKWLHHAVTIFAVGSILSILVGCAPDTQPSADLSPASHSSHSQQVVFATPEQAVEALVTAMRDDQGNDLLKILGPDAHQIIYSGDKVADQEGRDRFIFAYDQAHEIRRDDAGNATLVVGEEEWPLPIPLAHGDSGWWFDTVRGQEEILNRRIGRNELNVLEVCRVYVEAQEEFSALNAKGGQHHEYAQRFESHLGQHDGLYWPVVDGQEKSPLGPLLASAEEEGYSGKVLSNRSPYHGYYYRILKSQGSHASGGKKDYIVKGHMSRGFALIAFPARYGDSGVMTFIVGQNGIVYEKNLGFATDEIARVIRAFDPDDSWNVVQQ